MAAVMGCVESFLRGSVSSQLRITHQEVVLAERGRVAVAIEVLADAAVTLVGLVEDLEGASVETEDVPDHAPLRGAEQGLALGEDGGDAVSCPLIGALIAGDSERHVAGDDGELAIAQEAKEVWVRGLVEDDETYMSALRKRLAAIARAARTRIDVDRFGILVTGSAKDDGVGMAARSIGLFEEVDFVLGVLVDELT